ncbi:U6 snRNA phosphodiesterase [Hirsutella rhossiliensis]|uniref:U6 snRNA phosphodiesterase n=1 Tax=Hirsutella rhossiliensis TaxID=111463 RepID=A0A9P8N6R4_9HYPO|nr:U6 snRNA phosphodiesterase [Hirsutella rhossiliensis]KAH0968653.1 U6 snRNA phosphodiesterase [Hirsutella rhossiliensis]
MSLVDYSSSSAAESDADETRQPPAKRRKAGLGNSAAASCRSGGTGSSTASTETMPPLPAAFHDLYASTVRQSVTDDPGLHHGRKRQTPHVPGNWPTHLYIEWHPSEAQHNALEELLGLAEAELGDDIKLRNFLTSDLGAHLPLHISLSRPLSLRAAEKDDFLDRVTKSIRSSGTGAFAVRPGGLAWYRSPDSGRTFLILGVVAGAGMGSTNPQLMRLLTRCNTVSTSFNQPALYQKTYNEAVGSAFHVSIAWTFGLPDDEASLRVLRLFKRKQFKKLQTWEIDVSGVKAKIGNVVSHIPLAEMGSQAAAVSSSLLLGP